MFIQIPPNYFYATVYFNSIDIVLIMGSRELCSFDEDAIVLAGELFLDLVFIATLLKVKPNKDD